MYFLRSGRADIRWNNCAKMWAGDKGMLETVEGIYQNGHIKLLETPKATGRSRVVVTFLNDKEAVLTRSTIVNSGRILVDDLEDANDELRKMFDDAIEKSAEEFNR